MRREVMPPQTVMLTSTRLALLLIGLAVFSIACAIGVTELFDSCLDLRPGVYRVDYPQVAAGGGCDHCAFTDLTVPGHSQHAIASIPIDGTVTIDEVDVEHWREVASHPDLYCPRCTKFAGCRVGWFTCMYREGDRRYRWRLRYFDGEADLDWTDVYEPFSRPSP